MKLRKNTLELLGAITLIAMVLFLPTESRAHCDTLAGPVVVTAKAALEKKDVTPLLKWVRSEDEKEIKAAFQRTLAVRVQGKAAKEMADMYFFETLVRVHRAGEGAPYSGLKPGAEIDPAVVLADKALESGTVDKLVNVLTTAMAKGIRERFAKTYENQKHADDSIAAGREFVESYIIFTHYVEGLHGLIKGGAVHHGAEGDDH